jgi:phosphoribosylaminoimidazolecarboxamide formyltransferase/IMP cyclohydrolase
VVELLKKRQKDSYLKALAGDPLSAFGGIVAFNQKLTLETAKLLIKNFYEVIAAPGFEKDVIKLLQTKKNLRILKVKNLKTQQNKDLYSQEHSYKIAIPKNLK